MPFAVEPVTARTSVEVVDKLRAKLAVAPTDPPHSGRCAALSRTATRFEVHTS